MISPFQYASPKTLADAHRSRQGADTAEWLAGGSDLLALMKDQIVSPAVLVNVKEIPELAEVSVEQGEIVFGSAVTLADIADHAAVRKHLPALASAAAGLGSTQIRNVATIGGNLCQRNRDWYYRNGLNPESMEESQYGAIFPMESQRYVHPSTLAPALIALGAQVEVAGPEGASKPRPVESLFQVSDLKSKRETVLKPGEIITKVRVPVGMSGSANIEVRERQSHDWPLVQAAAALKMAGDAVGTGRVVLGHVAPVPMRLAAVEKLLAGKKVDEALATEAGKLAAQGAEPTDKNDYKVQLVKVAVKRAILAASGNEYWKGNA